MKEVQKQIIENYINAYNHFDIAGMTENLHGDIVFENISQGSVDLRTEGLEAFRDQAEKAVQFFNGRKQTAESWEFQDQRVIIQVNYQAVLAMDLPSGMKAGDTLTLKGQSEFLFKDNKIIGIRDIS
jgi:hypothetical protein